MASSTEKGSELPSAKKVTAMIDDETRTHNDRAAICFGLVSFSSAQRRRSDSF